MSNFCASCGAATGGGKFCPKCGSPQQSTAAPSLSQSPNPPVKRRSPVLKIALISLAVLLVLLAVGAVRGYYFLKDRVIEAKQEIANAKAGPKQPTQPGCDLLSKEKVTAILGTKVARVQGNDAGEILEYCKYYSQAAPPPDASTRDDQSKDGQPSLNDLQSIAKKLSDAAKDRPLMSVQIYRGGAATAIIAIKTVSRMTGSGAPSVPGPWDEAYFGPNDATFAVRKGDNGILLDLTLIDNKHDAALAVAKAMIAGL